MAGIYVHIPFCRQICSYCDYCTAPLVEPPDPFVAALCEEIAMRADELADKEPVGTIHFGGGTPSVLSAEHIARILDTIRSRFEAASVEEVAFEANPEDCSPTYLSALLDLGVTRVVVGVQSFYDDDLERLGRLFRSEQANRSLEAAMQAGFRSVAVDLLQAVPSQPPEYWAANLERVANQGVHHISAYELTVEPGTRLSSRIEKGELQHVSQEYRADQMLFTMSYLEERGYEQYEISGFALEGHIPLHQRAYWSLGNTIALGPSSHSIQREAWPNTGAIRWSNVRDTGRYISMIAAGRFPVESRGRIGFDRLAAEHIMLRLRTAEGLDLELLDREYGIDLLTEKVDDLASMEREGLVVPIRNGRLKLTRNGLLVCDAVTRRLLP